MSEEKIAKANELIEQRIKPALTPHGTTVKAVSFEDGNLGIRVFGKMPFDVVKRGLAAVLRNSLPEVTDIVEAPAGEEEGPSAADKERLDTIRQMFDDRINPALASHGGWASVVDVRENMLFIQVGGGCQGCSSSLTTVKQGIEGMVRQMYPEMQVVDTTDHAAGANPYYR
ncbi:MAG: NifU family protein [Deltaproteobacteria bacterium]|nr:NifU family protein [bacterium]MCB9476881.1 NifU family protein [Deltaproteobacteria bacterium]MCB9480048.1 NifU family protein [Deltaproteobacteria bacterium]MCB9489561.1 NifU family protein [Deltaproteobacteria bacterium]